MKNACHFSPCGQYRYRLDHDFQPKLGGYERPTRLVWIGLNPSTADHENLDNTLRRIVSFSAREGYAGFTMLNLFAYRTRHPDVMLRASDPIGPDNNRVLFDTCEKAGSALICFSGRKNAGNPARRAL